MPLESGSSPATISRNISELTHHGSRPRSHAQIVAIALSNADRHPHAHGGHVGFEGGRPADGLGFAAGGAPAAPWTERQEAREIDFRPGGFINSSIAGRTDRLPLAVASESHVLPADVMSGLGQGNSLAGANIMAKALRVGPWGTTDPAGIRGHGPPAPPHGTSMPQLNESLPHLAIATGGSTGKTSILAAGGEMVLPPDWWTDGKDLYRGVKQLGGGDLKKGHRVADEMIKRVREHTIKFLKNAPPPKK